MAQKLKTTPVTPGLLIEEAQGFQPPEMPKAPDVKQFQPITREIDPTKETAAGQITGLLSSESPYIAEARQRGIEAANQRGLLNTSISAGEAERAAIQAALPIAQQDAGTYFQQGRANQDIGAKTQGMEQGQTYALQGQEQEANIKQALMQTEQGQQIDRMREDAAIRGQMLDLDSQVRERLAGIEQGYALELEGLKQDYEIIKNKDTQMGVMYSDALKSISTFMDNPDMSAAQQKTGLNMIISNLQSGLQFMSGITRTPRTSTMAEASEIDRSRAKIPAQEKSDLDVYKEYQASGSNLSLADWTETNYPNRTTDYTAARLAEEEAAARAARRSTYEKEKERYKKRIAKEDWAEAANPAPFPTYEEWSKTN